MKSIRSLRNITLAASLLCASLTAQAGVIYTGSVSGTGSGLGTVNTILTLNNTGGTSNGAISYSATGDLATGSAMTGASQSATYSFGDLNITNASDIQLLFNATEPGSGNNGINVDGLTLSIFSSTGATLYSTSLMAAQTFASTQSGIGSIGFMFGLDAGSASAAQAFISATNRIGLSAQLSNAQGGPDTFFILDVVGPVPGGEVPEPASMLLIGLGLLGLGAARRKKV